MDVRMSLARIVIQDTIDQQIIFLRECDGEREFPIVIGDEVKVCEYAHFLFHRHRSLIRSDYLHTEGRPVMTRNLVSADAETAGAK